MVLSNCSWIEVLMSITQPRYLDVIMHASILQSYIIMLLFIQDERGETALIMACIKGHVVTADLLINRGANVNYLNKVRLILNFVFTVAMINVWSVLKLMSSSVSCSLICPVH